MTAAALILSGSAAAVAGQAPLSLAVVTIGLVLLLARAVRHVRDERWRRRTARWDRPEVWVVLDAVRDREAQRERNREAWQVLTVQLAGLLDGMAHGLNAISLQVGEVVDTVTRNFDARGRGFADQLAADRAGQDHTPEAPQL